MTERTEPACRYAGEEWPRLLRTHQRDCNTSGCPGCQPCPERHCQVCNQEHVTVDARGTDRTCASCIGNTRTDLARVAELHGLMTAAATERGIHSAAAMHAGPAANVEAWGYVEKSLTSGRLCRCRTARNRVCPMTLPPPAGPACDRCRHETCNAIHGGYFALCPDLAAWIEDCRDELHPVWVLGTWDFNVRDHLGHLEHDTTLTVADCAAYLDQHLTLLAHDPDFDFAQLASEVRACRANLDQVLAIAPHTETGAPCPACGKTNLEKRYGRTVDDDRWTCPKCQQWWTEDDYRAKVQGIYVQKASALTASQIRETYRVNESTVRTWAERGLVAKRGKDAAGRLLYDVAQVLQARDNGGRVAS